MTDNLELLKFTRLYLGQTNWELIKRTSEGELKLFQKFPIDLSKSYIVLGTEDLLNKYRAFFLTRCLKKRPLYAQYSMHDYASELSSPIKDDGGLNVDMDLIFLYRHRHLLALGRSEEWLEETVLNKVANRNRDGLVTVILSEVHMPALEHSEEMKIIDFLGVVTNERKEQVLKKMQIKRTSSSSGTDFS